MALGFAPAHPALTRIHTTRLHSEPDAAQDAEIIEKLEALTPEQQTQVGNLVADEEWAGLSMELADVVRTAVVEDLKKNSRDFLGKDDYAIGDFSKEIDRRVKDEVAKMREKDEYELGKFIGYHRMAELLEMQYISLRLCPLQF